jgi:hypothetical protein
MTTEIDNKVNEVREMVSTAASLLDTEFPGWAEAIDLDELNMDNCSRCVLGQIGTELMEMRMRDPYYHVMQRLEFNPPVVYLTDDRFAAEEGYEEESYEVHAFAGAREFIEYGRKETPLVDAYEDEWVKQIKERKNMDIGKEKRTITVEPLENPIPQEQPVPAREPKTVPRHEPAETPEAPVHVPEKAPAK